MAEHTNQRVFKTTNSMNETVVEPYVHASPILMDSPPLVPSGASASPQVAVIGLGYVGLPVALAFARKYPGTVGFDISQRRIEELHRGVDHTGEVTADDLKDTSIVFTSRAEDMAGATFIVVTVPTPVDSDQTPDLGYVESAAETVGEQMAPGTTVVRAE